MIGGMVRRLTWAGLILAWAATSPGCNNNERTLQAKRIEREDELIGGPLAKGQIGDFLLENDKVRVVITATGHSWEVGLFSGSLIDADLRRPERSFVAAGGLDQFAELFPTVNLVTANPNAPVRDLVAAPAGVPMWAPDGSGQVTNETRQLRVVDEHVSGVWIESDGSDGTEAAVVAEGRGAFLFEALGLLQSPELSAFVKNLKVGFDFRTTYAVRPGESWVRMRTTIRYSPSDVPAGCPGLPGDDCPLACPAGYETESVPGTEDAATGEWSELDCPTCRCTVAGSQDWQREACANAPVFRPDPADPTTWHRFCHVPGQPTVPCTDYEDPAACECGCLKSDFGVQGDCSASGGYRFEEIEVPKEGGEPGEVRRVFCPVCACDGSDDLPLYTESTSIFNDIIGDLPFINPRRWQPGMIAGDFLFFGKECNVFAPGLGYDEDRRIFENTWEGIGTISNPLCTDYVAAVGDRVSYGYFAYDPTLNVDEPIDSARCPTKRLALVGLNYRPQLWDEGSQTFTDIFDRHQRRRARAGIRQALVDDFGVTDTGVARSLLTALRVERTPLVLRTLETHCYNGKDDDADGVRDCEDTDCAGATCDFRYEECEGKDPCPAIEDPPADCDRTGDSRCDGSDLAIQAAIDAFDAALGVAVVAESVCTDGLDDDGDGLTDCDDGDCGSGAGGCEVGTADDTCNARGCRSGEADCLRTGDDPACCLNGADDDGDGAVDCDDDNCGVEPACQTPVASAEDLLTVGFIPAPECQQPKLLIPLFTNSATAVITHGKRCATSPLYGDTCQGERSLSYERFFLIGEGDVASILDSVYTLRGQATGTLRGAVLEAGTMRPVPHADVFVLRLPVAAPASAAAEGKAVEPSEDQQNADFLRYGFAWRDLMDVRDPFDRNNPVTYDMLVRANDIAFGNMGFVTQMQCDRGSDPRLDGDFQGRLLPGTYAVVARGSDTTVSALQIVQVRSGQTTDVYPLVPPPGKVNYRVYDEHGALVHAKLVFVALDSAGEECTWDGQPARNESGRICPSRRRVELGDGRKDDGVRTVLYAPFGQGSDSIEPGRYNVYVSHGLEFGIDVIENFEVVSGLTVTLEAQIQRELDTQGWIAGDFHLHARPSFDGGVSIEGRVTSNVIEGLELVTATDHDVVVDYSPYVNKLGYEPYLKTQVGVELTTLEFGHWNAYPLRYEGLSWPVHGAIDWVGLDNQELVDVMRDKGVNGPAETVVQCNHPRDGFMGYLDQLGLNVLDLSRETSLLERCNPQTERISCDFDAMEIMNEKRFELIRTPTVGELDRFSDCLRLLEAAEDNEDVVDLLGDGVDVPDTACHWALHLPFVDAQTCRDQACPGIDVDAGVLPPDCRRRCADLASELCEAERCTFAGVSDPDLRAALQGRCRARCAEDARRDSLRRAWHEEFRAAIVGSDGASHCADPTVSMLDCRRHAFEGLKYLAVRYMIERTPAEEEALMSLPAEQDPGCKLNPETPDGCRLRDTVSGCPNCYCESCVCELAARYPPLAGCCGEGGSWGENCALACDWLCNGCTEILPCTGFTNILDDWFKFLNAGLIITGVGNSDSHDLLYEGGIPRTFVRSSTDVPSAIDLREIGRNIKAHKAMFSTGPFIRFALSGETGDQADIGETLVLPAGEPVKAHVEVTTASWFGIDYVEVYRNGVLEYVAYPGLDYPAGEPSDRPSDILDYRATIEFARPAEDSWYLVLAYGLGPDNDLAPVYFSLPYGKILLPTVIELGFGQILGALGSAAKPLLDMFGIGGGALPERFPTLPFAATNPIFVDVDGDGWRAPEQRVHEVVSTAADGRAKTCTLVKDEAGQVLPVQSDCAEGELCGDDCTPTLDGDGNVAQACDERGYCLAPAPALPRFCSQPCPLKRSPDGLFQLVSSNCGENQICADDGDGDDMGLCIVPVDLAKCPNVRPEDTFLGKHGTLASQQQALTSGAPAGSAGDETAREFMAAFASKFVGAFFARCSRH